MAKIIDPSFGLDNKAQTLVSLLGTQEPSFAHYNEKAQAYDICLQTRAYYTGSVEPGWVAIILYPTMIAQGECKVVVFGEDVSSNQIIVQDWEPVDLRGRSINTVLGRFEQAYFQPQDIHKAGDYVLKLLKEGYERLREVAEPNPTIMQVLMKD